MEELGNGNQYLAQEKEKEEEEELVVETSTSREEIDVFSLLKHGFFFFLRIRIGSDSEREFSDQVLKIQSSEHSDPTKIFHWVLSGNLDALQRKLGSDKDKPMDIEAVDATGANVVHLAYLNGHYQMGHWLVETFPSLALRPYSDRPPAELQGRFEGEQMLFAGQNVLHILIVQRNCDEVRWLLDFYRVHRDSEPGGLARLLMQSATGRFFEPGYGFYFGSYPLQFAVCCNNIDIFDLVLSFSSSLASSDRDDSSSSSSSSLVLGPEEVIFMRDGNGNTLLHLCVLHGLKEMFERVLSVATAVIERQLQRLEPGLHVGVSVPMKAMEFSSGYSLKETGLSWPERNKYDEWLKIETRRKLNERMLLVLNSDLLSPLTLAAKLSKTEITTVTSKQRIEMINFVFSSTRTKVLFWTYGPVSNYHIDLNGLDFEYDLTQYQSSQEKVLTGQVLDKVNYSVMTWLSCNEDYNAIVIPEIKSIIEKKWERYGRPLFIRDYIVDAVITVLVTVISIFVNTSPSISPQYEFMLYLVTVLVFLSVTWTRPKLIFSLRGASECMLRNGHRLLAHKGDRILKRKVTQRQ